MRIALFIPVFLIAISSNAGADPKIIKIEKPRPKVIQMDSSTKEEESIKILGQFGQWVAFKVNTNRPYCYISASPVSSKLDKKRQIMSRFLVTVHGDFPQGEANYVADSELKEKSIVQARVDKTTVDLIAQKDSAWASSPDQDQVLIKACQKGEDLIVSGVTANEEAVEQRFSLKGFEKAYDAAYKGCF